MRPYTFLDGPEMIFSLVWLFGNSSPAIRVLRVNIITWQTQVCDRQRQLRWVFGDLERVPAEIGL